MKKIIRTRLALYGLYAALAIMFWFFDLMILAWIFAGLFILPVIIGGVILIYNSLKSEPREKQFIGGFSETPSKVKHREIITIKTPLTPEQKKEFIEAMKRIHEKNEMIYIDKAAQEELK